MEWSVRIFETLDSLAKREPMSDVGFLVDGR